MKKLFVCLTVILLCLVGCESIGTSTTSPEIKSEQKNAESEIISTKSETTPPGTETQATTETEVIETETFTKIIYSDPLPYIPDENADDSFTVKITYYGGYWYGISHKEITGSCAQKLASALSSLPETDEREAKLGDEELWNQLDLPVESGTAWIEFDDQCYRYTSGRDICRVEEKLGEGVILSTTDEAVKLIWTAYDYWPYDYYLGEYRDGVLKMEHKYSAESSVKITVKDIYVEKSEEPSNYIILEFVSDTDMTVAGYLDCETGGCIIFDGGHYRAELKAGVPQRVKITFGGDSDSYHIALREGNTFVRITIRQ